jgi:hypothetical protein
MFLEKHSFVLISMLTLAFTDMPGIGKKREQSRGLLLRIKFCCDCVLPNIMSENRFYVYTHRNSLLTARI